MKLAVGMGEAIKIMRFLEVRLAIKPAHLCEAFRIWHARGTESGGNYFIGCHVKSGMLGADPFSNFTNNKVIVTRFARCLYDFLPQLHMLVAATLIDIAMLEEGGCRQYDICHLCSIG